MSTRIIRSLVLPSFTSQVRDGEKDVKKQLLPEGSSSPPDDVQELNDLLQQQRATSLREHNRSLRLSQELKETKEQLARQRRLKELFIKKEKERRNELERLKRLSDPRTLCHMRIATEIHENIKRRKKKELQRDLVELKAAHLMSRAKFFMELQAERGKYLALQEEVEQLKVSYEFNMSREAELKAECEEQETPSMRYRRCSCLRRSNTMWRRNTGDY